MPAQTRQQRSSSAPVQAPTPAPRAPAAPGAGNQARAQQLGLGESRNPSGLIGKVYQKHAALEGKPQLAPNRGQSADLETFKKHWEKHQARYEAVSQKTGIPAKLVASLHWRESTGDFSTYLHQGDPLGKKARNEPNNIPIFHHWEDAAVHALTMKDKKAVRDGLGMKADTQDTAAIATYAEFYNGLGYHKKGRASPYVYSGTDQYQKGKYVSDGRYDKNHKDQQLGVLTMMDALGGLETDIK